MFTLLVTTGWLFASVALAQEADGPAVNTPASPDPQAQPGLAEEVFVASKNDNRSVYIINKNNQAIDVFLYCESSSGWRNNFAMVDANSHKLICDNVVNNAVYFWAKSENGECVWDGKDKAGSKPLTHPVDKIEYETLMYDIELESKIVGIPISGCNT